MTTIYKQLLGHTFTHVSEINDEIHLTRDDGEKFVFKHEQECCEAVWLEERIGNLEDLVGSPMLVAESRSSDDDGPHSPPDTYRDGFYDNCWAWTFIELATNKGSVTLRWFGASNGYYSVGVDLINASSRYWCN